MPVLRFCLLVIRLMPVWVKDLTQRLLASLGHHLTRTQVRLDSIVTSSQFIELLH
jgi:hypothetical protein